MRRVRHVTGRRAGKLVGAALIGLGLGSLLPPDPVAVPAVGTLPGPAVGVVGAGVGAALYLRPPGASGTDGCGCGGDCDCP